eukprot:236018-Pelagomonas_calceolata.AAC.2
MYVVPADLKYRLPGVWREAVSVDPRGNNNTLNTYQAWFATPFACNACQTFVPCLGKDREGYIAVPAYEGSLAEAKKVPVTKQCPNYDFFLKCLFDASATMPELPLLSETPF